MAVQLALTPDGHWNYPTAELISAAKSADFAAVGINADDVDASTAAAYAAADIGCHEVLALLFTDDEAATLRAAERLAAVAEALCAPWVLTVFPAPPSAQTTTTLRRCASMFAEAGSGMAVEFTPLGPVSSVSEALDVVRSARRDGGRAGVLIDTWHFFMSDSTWSDLAAVPLDDIAYLQFDDAPEPDRQRLVRDTLHRRAVPGQGVFELDRFAATLLERGWDGVVSVEVLSADLRTLPVDALARRLHDSATPYWTK
jgi:sugar phosphate isomerase/epimerase